jgi:hypothetical protein
MAEKSEKETQQTPTPAEVTERLRVIQAHRWMTVGEIPLGVYSEYIRRLREVNASSQINVVKTHRLLRSLREFRLDVNLFPELTLEHIFACTPTPAEEPAASEEPSEEEMAQALAGAAQEMITNAAARLTEEYLLYLQVGAHLEEVDEIIERLGRDREEIDSLKEETRSNISELQRMVAA